MMREGGSGQQGRDSSHVLRVADERLRWRSREIVDQGMFPAARRRDGTISESWHVDTAEP